jgi:antitoxin HicB
MSRFRFPITLTPASIWDPSETGFVVAFPDLPEGNTQGETEAEAMTNAVDCLEEVLAGRIDRGEDIPEPSVLPDGIAVEPGLEIAAKAGLYLAFRASGLSRTALAEKLGWDEKEIRRLLDPHHASKLPRIGLALEALGKRLAIEIRDAA